jgi:hypothetical protein
MAKLRPVLMLQVPTSAAAAAAAVSCCRRAFLNLGKAGGAQLEAYFSQHSDPAISVQCECA